MEFSSYDYNGYTIVCTPSGKTLVHQGESGDAIPPTGELVQHCDNLSHAMAWVNGMKAEDRDVDHWL